MKKFRERLALILAPWLKPAPTHSIWLDENWQYQPTTTTTGTVKVRYR
jgi:hypothetical protein